MAGLLRDRGTAGRPDPCAGDGAGRGLGDVVRRRRGARGRRHRRAGRIEARAVGRIRFGRAGPDRPARRCPRRCRLPAPARRAARLMAAQPARPAHGSSRRHHVASPPRPDERPQRDPGRDREDVRPLAPVACGPADARPGRHAAPRGGVLLHRRRRRAAARDPGGAHRRLSAGDPGRDGRGRVRAVLRRVEADAAEARRVRDAAARHADHDRGVAEGGPLVQAGTPGGRRRGTGSRVGRVQARPHRDGPRTADGRRTRRHGRSRQLGELRVRDHRGHHPAAGRRLARQPVRPRRRHGAPAPAVRPQDPLAHGDGRACRPTR